MSSEGSPTQIAPLPADEADNVSWEDGCFSVHVNDTSFELGALPIFPWNKDSRLVVRISPLFDSADPALPHMVDYQNAEVYMRNLVDRAVRAAETWKELLQEAINRGEYQIRLVFGEC